MRIDDEKCGEKVRRGGDGVIEGDRKQHLVAFVHCDKSFTIDIFSLVFK